MMRTVRYAEGTRVAVESSRAEVERLFRKCGATRIAIDDDTGAGVATLTVLLGERAFRFRVVRPTLDDARKMRTGGRPPRAGELEKLVDDEWRRRWRVLLLVSKAKLELVSSGESTPEREFLADLVMPGGRTLAEIVVPKIAAAYARGGPPRLGPGPSNRSDDGVLDEEDIG